MADISASIIQGSAIGPASYVVHASDLVSITAGNSLCKYADDTYVIIPASNHLSRSAELDNIQTWANHNNLHLNRAKCVEIVFSQTRRRRPIDPPPPLPDITRVSTIKILGVTITNKLSVSDHISSVIRSCAQSLHALRTLRHQGMDQELLQTVYRAVIIAKLMYASSAWWGFTTAADRQRLESFLRRARCSGLYHTDRPTVAQLAEDADDTLFSSVTRSSNHLLHVLLPEHTNHPYHLRSRKDPQFQTICPAW